ncbi:MAG: xanthine phosphoribosyltransferase [Clostridia bacterium]|nr:xanthine phosphoribosyltransferase [Clostridia bacterium]
MELLKERIRKEGKVLPGGIIKVDGFLNHKVDTKLLAAMAEEFEKHFDLSEATVVLTAEASGIALATLCANRYGLPLIYAKKAKSDNIEGGLLRSEIYSYTYKKKVTLLVSAEWLKPTDKVFIVDDFLANGEALRGLCEIVSAAGAELVGVGVAVEKGFQPGGKKLREAGVNLKSLAIIESADENGIIFREE